MPSERHLVFQDLTLLPSAEWQPRGSGWLLVRVAEGAGYWLQHGNARDLMLRDAMLTAGNCEGVLRASRLGPLKLQFFFVQPEALNGLLTVAEWYRLETIRNASPAPMLILPTRSPLAEEFSRLAALPRDDSLLTRCWLVRLWADAVAGLAPAAAQPPAAGYTLRDRFKQLVSQMAHAELARLSLHELAQQLHCSDRHFSRLFHKEFGVPLRHHQTELRLRRAQQLLTDPNAKVINVAYESGYRDLGLFNVMFKKHFGVTPTQWRRQTLRQNLPLKLRNRRRRLVEGTADGRAAALRWQAKSG